MTKLRRYLAPAAFVALLLVLHVRALLAHMEKAADPYFFNDDARIQIFPFFRYSDPAAFANDYLGDYALALLPTGYRALYWLGAHTVDAFTLSKILPYPMFLFTVAMVTLVAFRIGRYPAAFVAATIVLGSDLYIERITGGLPRSFGYPIAAAALFALVWGRWRWLAATTVIGAAFYPTLGLFSGLLLTLWMVVAPAEDRGDAKDLTLKQRFVVLASTAAVSAVLLIPPSLGSAEFGPRITARHFKTYPEAGPGGLSSAEDRPPFSAVLPSVSSFMERAVVGSGAAWWPWLSDKLTGLKMIVVDTFLLVGLFGAFVLARRRDDVRRLALFPIAGIIGHLFARGFAPYLYGPNRFVLYTVPLLFAVLCGIGLVGFVERFLSRLDDLRKAAAAGGLAILFMVMIGGHGHKSAGLSFGLGPAQQKLANAVAELPEDALVAGWPDDPLSNVPLVSRRRALITGEMHIAFHVAYLEQMRVRMRALIAAYYARSTEPILELRDELGVTHLIVNKGHLTGPAPGYAPPYGGWIQAAVARDQGKPYYLLAHLGELAVYQDPQFAILDLSRVPATP